MKDQQTKDPRCMECPRCDDSYTFVFYSRPVTKTLVTADVEKITAHESSLEEWWHEGPIEIVECCECGHKGPPEEFGYQPPKIEDLREALRWSLESDIRQAIVQGWDPPALTEVEQTYYATHIDELQTGGDLAEEYTHTKFGYSPSDHLRLKTLRAYYIILANERLAENK